MLSDPNHKTNSSIAIHRMDYMELIGYSKCLSMKPRPQHGSPSVSGHQWNDTSI